MILPPRNVDALRRAWRASLDDGHVSRETPCFRVTNATDDTAKLYVFGMIGGWDLDAGEFVQAVHAITASKIDMHVNTPGGFVYDGVAMYEAVRTHPAEVTTLVDGLAASAGSFLALAGDQVKIARGGRMMIHDAQMIGIGSPADLREAADLGDEVSNDIASIYADRAGGKAADWRAAMSATTWYSAQQAVDAGLAGEVTGGSSNTAADLRSQLIRARARVALGGV